MAISFQEKKSGRKKIILHDEIWFSKKNRKKFRKNPQNFLRFWKFENFENSVFGKFWNFKFFKISNFSEKKIGKCSFFFENEISSWKITVFLPDFFFWKDMVIYFHFHTSRSVKNKVNWLKNGRSQLHPPTTKQQMSRITTIILVTINPNRFRRGAGWPPGCPRHPERLVTCPDDLVTRFCDS